MLKPNMILLQIAYFFPFLVKSTQMATPFKVFSLISFIPVPFFRE